MMMKGKGGRQEDQLPLWHFLSEQSKKFRGQQKMKKGIRNIILPESLSTPPVLFSEHNFF